MWRIFGVEFPEYQEDTNIVINNSTPQQQRQGWNQQQQRSTYQDQVSYNKKIESQLAQLVAALPFDTNLDKVNAITTRGGKSTRDSPYPTRTGKTQVGMQEEEKRKDEVEEVEPQEQELQTRFL